MTSSYELRKTFIHIMTHGYKNNTYKFALARFLLDYCKALPENKLSKMVKTNDAYYNSENKISGIKIKQIIKF